jgi:hypothetical protein
LIKRFCTIGSLSGSESIIQAVILFGALEEFTSIFGLRTMQLNQKPKKHELHNIEQEICFLPKEVEKKRN